MPFKPGQRAFPRDIMDKLPLTIINRLAWSDYRDGCIVMLTTPRGKKRPIEMPSKKLSIYRGFTVRRLVMAAKLGRDIFMGEVISDSCGYKSCVNPDHLSVNMNLPEELIADFARRGEAIELINTIFAEENVADITPKAKPLAAIIATDADLPPDW